MRGKQKSGRSSKVGKRNSTAKSEYDFSKVEAKVDNKAPKFNPDIYLKSRNLLADAARLKIIDRENLELVQRLNFVYRLGGKTDCSEPTMKLGKSMVIEKAEMDNRRITRENKEFLRGIESTKATYPTAEFLRDWKRIELNMEHTAKYPLIWKRPGSLGANRAQITSDPVPEGADGMIAPKKRTRCFFDLRLKKSGDDLGRIVFELYDDIVPITCENFAALCRGHEGLSYRGTPFHRIVPGYWCQGGDVTKFNGTGGVSIYGEKFRDENFTLRHAGSGILSMWNDGPDKNDSKFNISFKSLPTMDGKRVVFGKIIRGLTNIYKIEELGCSAGKPIKIAIVSNCGVLRNGSRKNPEGI
ncbi:peptidyl-prolyl cis-trans isomerase E-like [Neodiprion virginianus]|uniref:peptidyl-prolyl cis-trans isomerase E-like n=1 Tax=Neodiprion virginianus TaxID=2961670 RepID=UPI001EE6B997|nr:peptidyl-prolyl cis-trans isomerase E-like [Neodiprion virginianus]